MEPARSAPTRPSRSIPAADRWAAARTAVVWEAIRRVAAPGPGTVIDVGGGTGGLAVRLAVEGHHVTVIDPSPDALAALTRRAAERGVQERVAGHIGDLDDLASLAPDDADLVLCHGVLGIVADPVAALRKITAPLRPGGTLSLLVAGRQAAVLARAMAGHLVAARDLLDDVGPAEPAVRGSERRFTAEELTGLLADAGLRVTTDPGLQGVRVFTDLIPSALLDEPGALDALVALERSVARRPEYLPLAAQLHALATRA